MIIHVDFSQIDAHFLIANDMDVGEVFYIEFSEKKYSFTRRQKHVIGHVRMGI